jgi:kynureninase
MINHNILLRTREKFLIPTKEGRPVAYFAGNSLGLQPTAVRASIEYHLKKWANQAVDGHFIEPNSWIDLQHQTQRSLSRLVGCKEQEAIAMGNLTTNLHLMFSTFYHPTKHRYKILMEEKAFPSDRYLVDSHVRQRGLDPGQVVEFVSPLLSTEEIVCKIQSIPDLALVFFGGVHYLSGAVLPMAEIAHECQKREVVFGLDLAHAIGNIPLSLHNWGVDFAAWCSYKYLNSGPGAIAGIFVHERHFDRPRLEGWWGVDISKRFEMKDQFDPASGIRRFVQSNPCVLSLSAHIAALEVFDQVGIFERTQASRALTSYLEELLKATFSDLTILTPSLPRRGSQLSIQVRDAKKIQEVLGSDGIIVDIRRPNVVRIAPTALYNTPDDIERLVRALEANKEFLI